MRIANIIEEGRLGGPQVRIVNVACALKDRVQTTVILPQYNSERFQKKLEQCDIPYKLFNISRITKEFGMAMRYVFFSVFEIIILAVHFKKQKFDLVHVSGGAWQYKGVIASALSGTRCVWHLNDTYMPKIFRWLFSLLSGLPEGFLFASERTRDYYVNLIPEQKQAFVIPAPVDTVYFNPEIVSSFEKDNQKSQMLIGTTVNINPIKGLEMFIETAAKLNEGFANLRFVIVGAISDNQYQYYTELVKIAAEHGINNLEFTGQTDDVRKWLGKIDIYLCTSIAESSPISVWEAMSMALPVVSTDVGDVSRYVISGQTGEIVYNRDVNTMFECVSGLIKSASLRKTYGIEARKKVIEELDLKLCADRHAAAYNKLV